MYTKGSIFGAFITLCILVLVTFSMGIKTTAASLILDDQSGEKGSTATFTVSIDNAPNEVAALGFEVRYDPSVLSYKGYSAGYLVSGFDFFDANNASPGTVRVGGFEAGPDRIGQGASGTAVPLTFDVVGDDDCLVSFAKLKDDIKGWSTEPGYFTGVHVVEDEPADTPAPIPADSPVEEEPSGNPTLPSPTSAVEEEPVHSPAPPPSGPPMSSSFNNIRYRGNTYRHQKDEPTIKAGDLNHSVYSNMDTDHSNLTSSGVNLNSETSKSHKRSRVAKLANNQEVLTVARATARVNQTTANLNNLPDRAHAEVQLKPYLAKISDSRGVQKDGFRALIAMMILFGSVYYIAVGLSILFAGYFLWELIKMGGGRLVAKYAS